MAKRIFFRPLANLLKGHPLVEQINKSDSIIHLKGNRPDIVCLGLNDGDGDRARGLRIYGFLGDEIQAIKRGILDEVIMPALGDTAGSWALLTGTPKGKLNHLWDLSQRHQNLSDWDYFHFFTSDNPFIPRAEIDRARQTLDPRTYRQEYEASFEDFLGKILHELGDRHFLKPDQIPTQFDRVYMGIDWGDTNPALVVIGLKDKIYYLVDEWYNHTGIAIPPDVVEREALRLAEKWGVYRGYADPSRPGSILAFRRLGHAGLRRTIKGINSIAEGLGTWNSLLYQGRFFIDGRLTHYRRCAESYHRATDIGGNVIDKIEDGQDDHPLDSTRYILATLEMHRILHAA